MIDRGKAWPLKRYHERASFVDFRRATLAQQNDDGEATSMGAPIADDPGRQRVGAG